MKISLHLLLLGLAGAVVSAQAVPPESASGAYIRVRDATYGVRYLPMRDAAGQATRFALVSGKQGEPMQVKHSWGRHGEFTVYPVEPDAGGAVMFARAPTRSGETYVPSGNPASLPNRLDAGHLADPNRTYYPVGDAGNGFSEPFSRARATPGLIADPGSLTPKGVRVQPGATPFAHVPPPGARIQPTLPPEAIHASQPGAPVHAPPPGNTIQYQGGTWKCGNTVRPTRPAERILAVTGGNPDEAVAIESIICTRGAGNPAIRGDLHAFICTRGVNPEKAVEMIQGIDTLRTSRAGDPPADVQAFICDFGLAPERADEVVDYLCTKGPRPADAREIQSIICTRGYTPEEAPGLIQSWCGTRFDSGQAAGRVEEICVQQALPAEVRDAWTEGCLGRAQQTGGELRADDLAGTWQQACTGLSVDPTVRHEVETALPGFCGTSWADAVSPSIPLRTPKSPPASPLAGYNPLDDEGDLPAGTPDLASAATIFAQIEQAHQLAAQGGAGTGDDGGAVVQPAPVIGADVAGATRSQREEFMQRPGVHASDPDASMDTGTPDPLGGLTEAIGAISGAIGSVQGAVDGVRDIDRQIDHLRGRGRDGDDHGDNAPLQPAPELARPTGGAAPVSAHTPSAVSPGKAPVTSRTPAAKPASAQEGHAHPAGGVASPPSAKPATTHAHPPATASSSMNSGYSGFLVTLQGDFLGAGPAENYNSRKNNLAAQGKPMDWKVIQAGLSSSAAAHRWILDNSSPAVSNSPYSGARVFRGQTVRVRANLEDYAR